MPWYSEKLSPFGTWSPQITPEKPTERSAAGTRCTLRRIRELQPGETHLGPGAIKAIEDQRADLAWQNAQGELGPRDMLATGLE